MDKLLVCFVFSVYSAILIFIVIFIVNYFLNIKKTIDIEDINNEELLKLEYDHILKRIQHYEKFLRNVVLVSFISITFYFIKHIEIALSTNLYYYIFGFMFIVVIISDLIRNKDIYKSKKEIINKINRISKK